MRPDLALEQKIQKMRHQRHVAPVTNLLSDRTVIESILNRGGCNRSADLHRRFEQSRFEWQHRSAVGTCALGKQDNEYTARNRILQKADSFPAGQSAFAIDKDRARSPCQPAEQRPCSHLALRYKHAGPNRAQDDDIQIAQMIADQKA